MSLLSVDYRYAPEHPHPALVEDSYGVAVAERHADKLGIDPARIAVVGEQSAGGGSAVARQILLFPMSTTATPRPNPR